MPDIVPALDTWLPQPAIRVEHRRRSSAAPARLWSAAGEVRLGDTQLLGRLVRWRIPGTPRETTFDELFRHAPFTVLDDGPLHLLAGIVGRIWTLRRDYPRLESAEAFRDWSERGTARVLFAMWVQEDEPGATLCSEVRVEAFGRRGRMGLATVRPLVYGSHHLIGSDGIAAAVGLAERGTPEHDPVS